MNNRGQSRRLLIVDGYNAIYQVQALRALLSQSLQRARTALIERCREWRVRCRDAAEIVIVFDGDPSVSGSEAKHAGVTIRFSKDRHAADGLIQDLVAGSLQTSRCTVVTDDRELLASVRRYGAETESPAAFLAPPRPALRGPSTAGGDHAKNGLTALETARITGDLRRAWGVKPH